MLNVKSSRGDPLALVVWSLSVTVVPYFDLSAVLAMKDMLVMCRIDISGLTAICALLSTSLTIALASYYLQRRKQALYADFWKAFLGPGSNS
ncbi:hypothetical protein [Paraburkholderia sp. C35]|uniref:hypothetical protein n=1 Tax=Paraburkholderia sp. C35 TaxID=2126993 RepID=UPI000D68A7EB|nr:hypothetical protein [Paraburkholderia sp. C35]